MVGYKHKNWGLYKIKVREIQTQRKRRKTAMGRQVETGLIQL